MWDSFIDSSAEILRQVQVLTVSKMKDNLQSPSYDLSSRSGNLARDVQGAIETQSAPGTMVFSRRKLTAPNAHLIFVGRYPVTSRQKAFFRFLSIMERGGQGTGSYGQKTPLSELYANMGNPKSQATIYGRPLVEESMQEVNWIDVVRKNIKNRVPNKVTRIEVG